MTNTLNTIYFAQQTGYLPVRTDAVDRLEMKQYLQDHPNARVAPDQTKYVRPVDEAATAPDGIKVIEAALAKVLNEQAPVKPTFDQMAADLKLAIAKVPGR
jgi:sn-glycerol 3-phosphate transport system substrate-binding protein